MSEEQKDSLKLSQASDLIKCRIPKKFEEGVEAVKKTADKVKKSVCNGTINVGSYMRSGFPVEAYTRSCGRH